MSEVEFNFSPRQGGEDPLYLDFVAARPPSGLRSDRAPGASSDPDRPLRLDLASHEPRPRGGGWRLILAAGLVVMLAGAVGAWFLAPGLRDRPAAQPAPPPPSADAASARLAPAAPSVNVEKPPLAAAPRDVTPRPPEALAPVARPTRATRPVVHRARHAAAHAHSVRKPRVAASEHRPARAAVTKKLHGRPSKAARTEHRHAKADLDFDAIAKSLQ